MRGRTVLRRLSAAGLGMAVAAVAARDRQRLMLSQKRFVLLSDLADVADGRLSLAQTANRVCQLVVPAFADICLLDVVGEQQEGIRRIAVKASGPGSSALEPRLAARPSTVPGRPGSGSVTESGRPQLIEAVTDELVRQGAHDEEDLALLRSLEMVSSVVVPLRSRGRTLGAITLITTRASGRRYTADDLSFVEVMAGRVALALDNAGLFTELRSMEARLTVALGSLPEAVTIQNPRGELIYANQAAAEMMGYETPQQVLEQSNSELVSRFAFFHEDGTPLDPREFPGRRLLGGEPAEPVVMRVIDTQTGEQRWRVTQATPHRGSGGELAMVVNVISDITAIKQAELAQELLSRAGETLASSMELPDTLQRVADLCVPELADWCAVRVPDERDELRTVAVAHSDPEKVKLAWRITESTRTSLTEPRGAAAVYRDGTPMVINHITEDMLAAGARDEQHLEAWRKLQMRAAMVVPMTTGRRTVGVLALVSAESGRSFSEADVALAGELASRAGTAVENARLYTERSDIARTLQTSLLPEELPAIPGYKTAATYLPAGDENQVGGDFYEAIRLPDGWMVVVGDVSGRGAPAAALTARMRHTLRTAAVLTGSATEALMRLNQDLVSRPEVSLCTAACLLLRDGEERAEIICAGHPPPILIRAGQPSRVGDFGPVLGAFADQSWPSVSIAVAPSEILVLYSDGVIDAAGADEHFGEQRLETALTGATGAGDAVARIEAALAGFQVGSQSDDIAVLALERVTAA